MRYLSIYLQVTVFLICGCANGPVRMGLVNRELPSAAQSEVSQRGGRDVINVSPTLAVSGGGGVILAMGLLTAAGRWMRARRTVRTMVSAIENLNDRPGREVKRQSSRAALSAGVADYLHGVVGGGTRRVKTNPQGFPRN